jgi:hypothetical protein
VIMRQVIDKVTINTAKKRDGCRYMSTDLPKSKVRLDLEAPGASRVRSVAGSVMEPTK